MLVSLSAESCRYAVWIWNAARVFTILLCYITSIIIFSLILEFGVRNGGWYTKFSKDFSNEKKVAVCAECKGSYHFGFLRVDLLENYKKLTIKRKAGWKCGLCSQETTPNASESDQEPGSVIDCIQGICRELKVRVQVELEFVPEVKNPKF